MALVNEIHISGYVATEPKVFGRDNTVGRIRLRHDRNRKVKDEWVKEASFFSIVVFGEAVDRMLELNKGDKIVVVGRLQQNVSESEGSKREFVDIVASEFAHIPDGGSTRPQTNDAPSSQEAQDFLDVS